LANLLNPDDTMIIRVPLKTDIRCLEIIFCSTTSGLLKNFTKSYQIYSSYRYCFSC